MNKNLNVPSCLSVVLFVLIVLCVMFYRTSSNYVLSPTPVVVKGSEGSFFDLKYDISCVPGPEKTAAYYTRDLTPGGYCGAQAFVRNQADYEIIDGIGGSLLNE